MDANRIRPSNPTDKAEVRGRKPDRDDKGFSESLRQAGHHHPAHEPGEGHGDFADDSRLLGIPPEELTDTVRQALGTLIDEINALRHQLEQAHSHESFLENQMQEDQALGILNARGLTARLSQTTAMVARGEMHAAFVHIHLRNLEAIRIQYGHGAALEVMSQTTQVMRSVLEPGDVPGTLGDADVGLILAATDIQGAVDKARAICQRLDVHGLQWHGEQLSVETVWGVAEVTSGTPESVFEAAEDNLRVNSAL